MAVNKEEQIKWREREQSALDAARRRRAGDRLEERLLEEAEAAKASRLGDALADLLDEGKITRLLVRYDALGGATFTIKATFGVQDHRYLHGRVKDTLDLSRTIAHVLERGKWHEDKYPAKE